jgi:hypothetical protein
LQIAPITATRKQVAVVPSPHLTTHLVRRTAHGGLATTSGRPSPPRRAVDAVRPLHSRWLEHGRGVVPRIWMPHQLSAQAPQGPLRRRAHAGRQRPAGHLVRPLDDGRLLDATRHFSLSDRTHQAKLPERRPEAGPWQERCGGCGKSSEHDHYFPSRADRFTGLFLESRCHFSSQTWTEIALLLGDRMSKIGDSVHLCVRGVCVTSE